MSAGGGSSNSHTQSTSSSERFGYQEAQSYLDQSQAQAQRGLQDRFFGAMDRFGEQQQGMETLYGGIAGQAINGGAGFDYSGMGSGQGSSRAAYNMGGLEQFVGGQNPYLQQQVDQFGNDIDRQFGVMQQRLGGDSAAAGQRGSSRQGIAESGALGEYLNQFQQGVTNMRSNAYALQQQAATDLAGNNTARYGADSQLAGAQAGASASRYASNMNAQAQQEQLRQQGLELGMQGLQNIQASQFNPFQIGAGVIGSPSVLQNSWGLQTGSSESHSSGDAHSQNFSGGIW